MPPLGKRQLVIRGIFAQRSPRSNGSILADRNRGNQIATGANKSSVPNNSPVLIDAVIITGNGASANVNAIANFSITDVT